MTQRNLFCFFVLAFCFPFVSPFGGSLNLATLSYPSQGITLSGATGSKAGTSITYCDFNADGVKDTIIGAPGTTANGKVLFFPGGTGYSGISLSNPSLSGGFTISYTDLDGFGTQVVCLGNIDGDFGDEIAVGVADGSKIFILPGSTDHTSNIDLGSLPTNAYTVLYSSSSETLVDIASLGDTTGDGKPDLIVSLFDGSKYSAAVLYGTLSNLIDLGTVTPSVLFRISNGGGQTDKLSVASAGKFDGDNFYDFAVGNLNGGAKVAVIFGKSGGGYSNMDFSITTYTLATAQKVLWINADTSFGLGVSMTYAGDVNNDGRGDLLIGGPRSFSNFGAAFLILGSLSFSTDISISSLPDPTVGYVITHGSTPGLNGGTTVFGCIKSATSGPCTTVAVCDANTKCYFVLNPASGGTGLFDLDEMKSEDGFPIYSSSVSASNPMQIMAIADANSDGYPDVLIGQGTATSSGKVYVVYGPNKCTSPCKTCSGLIASNWATCLSCESGLGVNYVYNGACYGTCPSQSYSNSASSCAACDSNCLDCDGSATSCTSCDAGGSYPLLYNNKCYATGSCPSHSYQDSPASCAQCDANCLGCSGDSTICTSCNPSGSLPYLYSSVCYSTCPPAAPFSYENACIVECPSGTSADSSNACVTVTTTTEVPQAVQTLSSADDARQVSNEVLSIVSSFTSCGVHSMRSQSVQGPMNYYVFLNVDYPLNYQEFAKSNFENSKKSNPLERRLQETDVGSCPVNEALEDQSLLANIGYTILLLAACVLVIPLNDGLLAALQVHDKNCHTKWYHRLLKKSSVSLRWSFLLNQSISKYQDLTFFSFLGVSNAAKGNDDDDTLNTVVCVIGFIITVTGLAGAFIMIKILAKRLSSLSEQEKEKEEYSKDDFLGRRLALYKDLNKDQFITLLYPFFLMLRVFGFSFLTVFLCKQTALQLVYLNLYAVFMLIYLLKYQPLEERNQHWMTLAYEIDALVAVLGVTLLAIYNTAGGINENTRSAFGYMIIIANTGMLILNFISFFLEIREYVVLIYEKLKAMSQKSKNKNKVRPEPIQVNNSPLVSPTSSFVKLKSFKTRSVLAGTPSVIPEEGHAFSRDESPGLSPQNLSEVKLSPFSSCIEPTASTNDRLSLLKIESSMEARRYSTKQRMTQNRRSINIPVEEIPESQLDQV